MKRNTHASLRPSRPFKMSSEWVLVSFQYHHATPCTRSNTSWLCPECWAPSVASFEDARSSEPRFLRAAGVFRAAFSVLPQTERGRACRVPTRVLWVRPSGRPAGGPAGGPVGQPAGWPGGPASGPASTVHVFGSVHKNRS